MDDVKFAIFHDEYLYQPRDGMMLELVYQISDGWLF